MSPVQVSVGDTAHMRKMHPCGNHDWEVTRVGADIGLKCLKCGRRIMLSREEFERGLKQIERPLGKP